MKIKILGGFGAETPGCGLTGFLVNGKVMLDAGTLTSALSVAEQSAITHILLSHAHLDHSKGIPFLADNIIGHISAPVEIVAIEDVLDTLAAHIFNNKIWPDFTRIPTPQNPVLKYRPVVKNRTIKIGGGLTVKPILVNHPVPTTGYIITEGDKAIVYSGDTKETSDIWKAATKLGTKLKAVLVETSFPNRLQPIADISGHLTPKTLGEELKKIIGFDGPVYVYHAKSQYLAEIKAEIKKLGRKNITVAKDGKEFEV